MRYKIEIVMLGTGATIPTRERLTPSILVRDWLGNKILLDAGEGAQIRLSQASSSPASIDLIAISHEHGDHVNGLPGLLQSMYIGGRKTPLTILAPKNIAWYAREALEATEEKLGFKINIVEIENKGSIELGRAQDKLAIKWFPVCHNIETYGFKLEWTLRPRIEEEKLEALGLKPGPWLRELIEKGETTIENKKIKLEDVKAREQTKITITYTSDTKPCEEIIKDIEETKILIHDSTYAQDMEKEAEERGHSTSKQAAQQAVKAKTETLILTHISARYNGTEARKLQKEAQEIFKKTILAWDNMKIIIL